MVARAQTAPQRAADDPDVGFFKRRALRIKALGIVQRGPTALFPPPAPEPTRADAIVVRRRAARIEREHAEIVAKEIVAVDARVAEVDKLLAQFGRDSRSYAAQELAAEKRQLRELRVMLQLDRTTGPILTDRNGRGIDDRTRRYVKFRARELAESYWRAAERDAAAGDHREARRHRLDALRARMIAEDEARLRGTVPGFGLCAWN
jgi:hypothetical protein